MKRLFDLSVAMILLVLFAPLLATLALVVKFTSAGPVFFSAQRIGHHGKTITCYKFRTMCVDAKEKLKYVLSRDTLAASEWAQYHKLKADPRVTPVGSFLRKSSLDELPQLWNILKGDLSFVGPRPMDLDYPGKKDPAIHKIYETKLLKIKPGVISLWHCQGRNSLTFHERLRLEVEYVESQSFWLDLQIICKTFYSVIFLKGAY